MSVSEEYSQDIETTPEVTGTEDHNKEIAEEEIEEMEKEENEEFAALSEEIKKMQTEEEPQCCGCLNICMASSLMGFFYLIPLIPLALYFRALWHIHLLVFFTLTIFAVMCTVTAILCFYNAYKPQIWCCEWIGIVQIILFAILTIVSMAALVAALLQAFAWQYYQQFEDKVDKAFTDAGFSCLSEWTGKQTAYFFCLTLGMVSFCLGAISMYIAGTFREMSHHIFDLGIFKDYEALKAMEKDGTECTDSATEGSQSKTEKGAEPKAQPDTKEA